MNNYSKYIKIEDKEEEEEIELIKILKIAKFKNKDNENIRVIDITEDYEFKKNNDILLNENELIKDEEDGNISLSECEDEEKDGNISLSECKEDGNISLSECEDDEKDDNILLSKDEEDGNILLNKKLIDLSKGNDVCHLCYDEKKELAKICDCNFLYCRECFFDTIKTKECPHCKSKFDLSFMRKDEDDLKVERKFSKKNCIALINYLCNFSSQINIILEIANCSWSRKTENMFSLFGISNYYLFVSILVRIIILLWIIDPLNKIMNNNILFNVVVNLSVCICFCLNILGLTYNFYIPLIQEVIIFILVICIGLPISIYNYFKNNDKKSLRYILGWIIFMCYFIVPYYEFVYIIYGLRFDHIFVDNKIARIFTIIVALFGELFIIIKLDLSCFESIEDFINSLCDLDNNNIFFLHNKNAEARIFVIFQSMINLIVIIVEYFLINNAAGSAMQK